MGGAGGPPQKNLPHKKIKKFKTIFLGAKAPLEIALVRASVRVCVRPSVRNQKLQGYQMMSDDYDDDADDDDD